MIEDYDDNSCCDGCLCCRYGGCNTSEDSECPRGSEGSVCPCTAVDG